MKKSYRKIVAFFTSAALLGLIPASSVSAMQFDENGEIVGDIDVVIGVDAENGLYALNNGCVISDSEVKAYSLNADPLQYGDVLYVYAGSIEPVVPGRYVLDDTSEVECLSRAEEYYADQFKELTVTEKVGGSLRLQDAEGTEFVYLDYAKMDEENGYDFASPVELDAIAVGDTVCGAVSYSEYNSNHVLYLKPDNTFTLNGVNYTIFPEDQEVWATGIADKRAAQISIPAEIDGLPVVYALDETAYKNTALQEITVADGVSGVSSVDGVLFNADGSELLFCPRTLTGGYTIPEGTKEVGSYAFMNCAELTELTIPESVQVLGNAFCSGCEALTKINGALSACGDFRLATPQLTDLNIAEGENFGSFQLTAEALQTLTFPETVRFSKFCLSDAQVTDLEPVSSYGEINITNCDGLESLDLTSEKGWVELTDNANLETVSITSELGCGVSLKNNPNLKAVYLNGRFDTSNATPQLQIENCPNVRIYCEKESYETIRYCLSVNIPVRLTDAVLGDMDDSGTVTLADVIKVNRKLLAQEPIQDNDAILADVDGDGIVSPEDALNILCYVLELIDIFPIDA